MNDVSATIDIINDPASGRSGVAEASAQRGEGATEASGPRNILTVAEPAAGHESHAVAPDQSVALTGDGFATAAYEWREDGLLITLDGGKSVLLTQEAGGAPDPSSILLASLEGPEPGTPFSIETFLEQQGDLPEPAAGDSTPAASHTGGGADFAAFDPGSIGDGLDHTGALAPTSLAAGAAFADDRAGARQADGENNNPPLSEPDKVVLVPDHIGPIGLNTHAGTDPDGDVLTYTINDVPPPEFGVLTIGHDGPEVTAGQVLSEADYLALYFDPAAGAAGESFDLHYTVSDGSGGTDPGVMAIRVESAADGPWHEQGNDGHDVIRGSWGDDTIIGNEGNDYLKGGAGDDTLIGGAGDDVLHGGGGNDTMIGGAGHDRLTPGEGDDVIVDDLAGINIPDSATYINGGPGHDVLKLDGEGLQLDLNNIADFRVQGIEEIDLGGGGNTLRLDISEVLNISDTTDTLTVKGGEGDAIAGSLIGATVDTSHADYTSYIIDGATLVVENTIDQSGLIV